MQEQILSRRDLLKSLVAGLILPNAVSGQEDPTKEFSPRFRVFYTSGKWREEFKNKRGVNERPYLNTRFLSREELALISSEKEGELNFMTLQFSPQSSFLYFRNVAINGVSVLKNQRGEEVSSASFEVPIGKTNVELDITSKYEKNRRQVFSDYFLAPLDIVNAVRNYVSHLQEAKRLNRKKQTSDSGRDLTDLDWGLFTSKTSDNTEHKFNYTPVETCRGMPYSFTLRKADPNSLDVEYRILGLENLMSGLSREEIAEYFKDPRMPVFQFADYIRKYRK